MPRLVPRAVRARVSRRQPRRRYQPPVTTTRVPAECGLTAPRSPRTGRSPLRSRDPRRIGCVASGHAPGEKRRSHSSELNPRPTAARPRSARSAGGRTKTPRGPDGLGRTATGTPCVCCGILDRCGLESPMEGIDGLRQCLTSRFRRPNRLDRQEDRQVGIVTDGVSRIGRQLAGQADPGQLSGKIASRLALTECKHGQKHHEEGHRPQSDQRPGSSAELRLVEQSITSRLFASIFLVERRLEERLLVRGEPDGWIGVPGCVTSQARSGEQEVRVLSLLRSIPPLPPPADAEPADRPAPRRSRWTGVPRLRSTPRGRSRRSARGWPDHDRRLSKRCRANARNMSSR